LPEPIHRLAQSQHLPLITILDESGGLRDVHLFFKLTVEKRRLDIEVVHLPLLLRGDGEQQPN
jgi:hypothetical protein